MPLRYANDPTDPADLKVSSEQYIVFFSSVVDGKLWCPDCRDVDKLIQDTFSPSDAPSARIVYVGDRAAWKRPAENIYREQPWNISSVPTIVKLIDGVETARLVDDEIASKLSSWIRG